jgi:rhodanese-related sulfurtransferase
MAVSWVVVPIAHPSVAKYPEGYTLSTMNRFRSLLGPQIPAVDVTTAHERGPGVALLDVREPDEWSDAHAPGAHHLPLGDLALERLPAAETVYVICRSGNRSAMATQALVEAGIDAHNVDGGMISWTRAGLPVERGS